MNIRRLENMIIMKLLYWLARLGLGLTFIASGIRKLPGVNFTALPDTNPVGAFFGAMEALPLYWHFIGYYQILVGVLALLNRWSAMAGVLMLPVTANIFLISVALHMSGTPWITALMLLGNIYFMVWHRDQYRGVLSKPDFSKFKLR